MAPKKSQSIEDFKRWIVARGAELLTTTNEWEVVRYRCIAGVGVIYLNKKERMSFAGPAQEAWSAFLAGKTDYRFTEKTPRKLLGSVVTRTLLKRDGDRCFYCGEKFGEDCPPTKEHLVPRTAGGPDHISNLFLACGSCNAQVGHKSAPEKIRFRDRMRRGLGMKLLYRVYDRMFGGEADVPLLDDIEQFIHHQAQKETANG